MNTDKDNKAEDLGKIADYLAGEASVKAQRDLERWMEEDTANKIFFKKIKRIWQASEISCEKFCPNINHAWERVKLANKDKVRSITASKKSSGQGQSRNWYIAAAVVLVVFIGLGWLTLTNDHFIQKIALQKEKVEASQKGKVVLSDGSKVWLNSNAQFYYPSTFDKEERTVYLEGEAYFEIARDTTSPFVIYTGKGVTEVLGTAFNVNSKKETVVVTVARGQVALYPEGSREKGVILTKGDMGLFKEEKNEVSKTKNTNINFLSWRTGVLTFKDTALESVAKTLSKHYDVTIKLGEGISNHCRLTSTFKDKSLAEVLELLKLTLDIEIKKEKDHFLIIGRGC